MLPAHTPELSRPVPQALLATIREVSDDQRLEKAFMIELGIHGAPRDWHVIGTWLARDWQVITLDELYD